MLNCIVYCYIYIFYIMKNVHAYLTRSPNVKPADVDDYINQIFTFEQSHSNPTVFVKASTSWK